MAENELRTALVFPLDKQGLRASISALKELSKEHRATAKAAAVAAKEYDFTGQKLSKLTEQERDAVKVSSEVNPALDKEAKAIREVGREAEKAALSYGGLADERSKVVNQAAVTAAGAVGGAGRDVGIQPFVVDFRKMEQVIKAAGKAAGVSVPLIDNMGSGLKAAVPAISAVNTSFLAVAAAALPLLAVGTALAVVGHLNRQRTEALKKEAEGLKAIFDVQRDVNQQVAQGLTSTAAEQQIAQLERQAEAEEKTLAGSLRLRETLTQNFQEDFGILSGVLLDLAGKTDPRVQELNTTISESGSLIAEYRAEINRLGAVTADGTLATNNAVAALEELATAEEKLKNERVAGGKQLQQIQTRINSLDQQHADAVAANALKNAQSEEDALLSAQFAREDDATEAAEHYANLASIATDGRARLEEINADIAALPAERTAELQKIESKANKKRADINSDFMAKQIDATRDFHRQTARAEFDNRRARLRLIEDITESLEDAARENNVVKFLAAERSGAKRLRRQAQEDQTGEQRRVENFARQQEKAAAAQERRTQATIEGIETERQKVIESFDKRRQALLEAIATEEIAIQKRLDSAVASYDKQETREALQAERQRIRDEIRDGRAEQQHQTALSRIAGQEAAQQRMFDAMLADVLEIDQNIAANRLETQRQENIINTPSRRSSGVSTFTPLASGGIVTRPTRAIVGDMRPPNDAEAIIPFKLSDGMPRIPGTRGSRGGTNITFAPQLNATIGDIASRAEVTAAFREYTEVSMRELHRLFEQSGLVA